MITGVGSVFLVIVLIVGVIVASCCIVEHREKVVKFFKSIIKKL